MKFLQYSIFSFLILIFAIGCYTPRYVYSPSAQNVPLITEKGDSKLGVLYSTNAGSNNDFVQHGKQSSNGVDVQGAYAVSNHWAVQLNYFYRHEQNSDDNNTSQPTLIRYNRNLLEAAIGYYLPTDEQKSMFFQAFLGVGKGLFRFKDYELNATATTYRNFHQSDIFKVFVQPAFMYQSKKRYSISVTSRFSFIHYNHIKTDYDSSHLALYELNNLKNGSIVFWEPAVIFNTGLKKNPYIRAEIQLGAAALMNKKFVDARTLNFSVGVQADFVNMLKRKASQNASKK